MKKIMSVIAVLTVSVSISALDFTNFIAGGEITAIRFNELFNSIRGELDLKQEKLKEYTEEAGDFTVTGLYGWVTDYARLLPYETQSGWRLKFNIRGTINSTTITSYGAVISGVDISHSSISTFVGGAGYTAGSQGFASGSRVYVYTISNPVSNISFSGDIPLTGPPSFID